MDAQSTGVVRVTTQGSTVDSSTRQLCDA